MSDISDAFSRYRRRISRRLDHYCYYYCMCCSAAEDERDAVDRGSVMVVHESRGEMSSPIASPAASPCSSLAMMPHPCRRRGPGLA